MQRSEYRELLATSIKYWTWRFLELWTVFFLNKEFSIKKNDNKSACFWCCSLELENKQFCDKSNHEIWQKSRIFAGVLDAKISVS